VSTNSYDEMYKEQLQDRWQYHYPPFYRIIKVTLKHKNFTTVEQGASWLGTSMNTHLKEQVLGPTTPVISKVRNYYIKHLIVKIAPKQSVISTKKNMIKIINAFQAIKEFRAIKLIIDVDYY
jgi:primosomal protein N' (replication factor Y)